MSWGSGPFGSTPFGSSLVEAVIAASTAFDSAVHVAKTSNATHVVEKSEIVHQIIVHGATHTVGHDAT